MCRNIADIQSATAEIRAQRKKGEERMKKKKEATVRKYNGLP